MKLTQKNTKFDQGPNSEWKEMYNMLLNSLEEAVFILHKDGTIIDFHKPAIKEDLLGLETIKIGIKITKIPTATLVRELLHKALQVLGENEGKKLKNFVFTYTHKPTQCRYKVKVISYPSKEKRVLQEPEKIIVFINNLPSYGEREVKLQQQVKELERTKKAMVNLLEDIQEEKNLSESLAKDLEKFKLAVESASDLISITDPNGYILYANKALTHITGFKPEEVIGKTPGEVWGNNMEKEFYAKMWQKVRQEKAAFVGEFNNRRKSGEKYIAEVQIAPILDHKNKVIFFLGVERDITRMKEIDRMKSEFISVASHQLRTPLTGIKWFSELLLQNKAGELSPNQKDFIKQIFENNERMIKLVNDLLNVSHIESGTKFILNKRKIDIIPLVKAIIEEQRILAKNKNIQIIAKSITGKCMAVVDGEKIQQVIQNLLNNAVKYSFPKSDIVISLKQDQDMALFSVQDKGVGINVEQQGRIFEKFFRAKNITAMETNGNGLGLYIAKAIVEAHGGKIWFESQEKNGTTFYFSLPLNNNLPNK